MTDSYQSFTVVSSTKIELLVLWKDVRSDYPCVLRHPIERLAGFQIHLYESRSPLLQGRSTISEVSSRFDLQRFRFDRCG